MKKPLSSLPVSQAREAGHGPQANEKPDRKCTSMRESMNHLSTPGTHEERWQHRERNFRASQLETFSELPLSLANGLEKGNLHS